MLRSSYDATNANIKVKINGAWQPASPRLRDIYIGYKSMPIHTNNLIYSKNGITIFRTENDPYMPTFYRWDGQPDTETEEQILERNGNDYIFPEHDTQRYPEVTPTPTPIIDFNDIYVFLVDGVTGPGSRSGGGWVKARNYQAWAFIDFIYDVSGSAKKCYASPYSTYLAFPAGFDNRNVVTIDIEGLPPNIIFSISRNENNSVYYERNDASRSRVRICDNERARTGFLGFYTRLTMDVGVVITPPPYAYAPGNANSNMSGGSGSGLVCIGNQPPMVDLTDDEEHQCIMCYENKKNVQFMPCNHVISCYRCVLQMNKSECPVCKSAIHRIQHANSA